MKTYDDLVAIARIAARQSRLTPDPEQAKELMRLAKEYQQRAADMDCGKLPDIAEESWSPRSQGSER